MKLGKFKGFTMMAFVSCWAHKSRLFSLIGGFFIILDNGLDNVFVITKNPHWS